MKLYGICYIFNLAEAVVQLRNQLSVSHYGGIDNTISGNIIGNAIKSKLAIISISWYDRKDKNKTVYEIKIARK